MPTTTTRWREDAAGVERHRNAVQARYAGRLERFDNGGDIRCSLGGARWAGFTGGTTGPMGGS
jgi:hypothetical protein